MQHGVRTADLTSEALWRLGQSIYDRELKDRLEPAHDGEFVVINVTNGDFFIDADEDRAIDAAEVKYPDEVFYICRIGSATTHRIGRQEAA